jgi:serine/threonine protein kinase
MPMPAACPDHDSLCAYALGRLPEDQTAALERHLEGCGSCLEVVQAESSRDPLARALAEPPGPDAPPPPGADAEALLQRLKRLAYATRPGGTPTASVGTTPGGRRSPDLAELTALLAPPDRPGDLGRLGPYRVLDVLGVGGMGAVFRAEDPELRRVVALKVMRPDVAAKSGARERFLREARAAAGLKSDHVVTIHQVGEDRGVAFLAMEYLEGETLEARLARGGTLPPAEVVRIGRETAEGLAAAHARGLVHRDIKPGNIWLEARGHKRPACEPGAEPASGPLAATGWRAKLLDFGLARDLAEDAPLTQEGMVVGTLAYMAPEQARGEPADHRCDLFALGAVLHRACTGQRPAWAPGNPSPRPPAELNPAVPVALSELVLRLLAPDPAARPASARAVAEALRSLESGRPADVAALPGPAAPTPTASRRGRRRWPVLAAAAALLVVLGLATLLAGRQRAPAGPLQGSIDVLVHSDNDPARRNVRLHDAGALPLRPGDAIAIEAELSRPAYLYVLWIDTDGQVQPVYPWKPGHWEVRPAVEQRVARLRRPEALDDFYPIQMGTPGMHTLALLARETPLPVGVDLRAELGDLGRQTEQDLRAAVWFENGAVVRHEQERGPVFFDARRADDPVLRAQQRLRELQQRHGFRYTCAVSLADRGK